MPGLHNVYNALATVATAFELDIPFQVVQETLRDFGGIQRRFQIKSEKRGIAVVDDYGHHPAEIMATLRAARTGWQRIVGFPTSPVQPNEGPSKNFCPLNDADVLILPRSMG
jgi:UDP-N-acetylmuramate--alanine ligase